LLAELSAAHGLNRVERSLLAEAAASRAVPDAALLFVDPRVLKDLAQSGGANSTEYAALARKLFG
jgi:hypothetical protein